jgi:hypothetical protein
MYLRPCRNCHKYKECEKRKAKVAALKGSGITSAKFICKEFFEFFKPGDRVNALMSKRFEYIRNDDVIMPGTVTEIKTNPKGKVVILLDDFPFCDDNGNPTSRNKFMSFWPKHLELTGEPTAEICKQCGIPRGRESESTNREYPCGACFGSFTDLPPRREGGWHNTPF